MLLRFKPNKLIFMHWPPEDSILKEAVLFLKNKPIGECTVLLGGVSNKVENSFSESKLLTEMNFLIQNGFSYSEAARELSKRTGISRRFLYSLLHNTSNENIQDP